MLGLGWLELIVIMLLPLVVLGGVIYLAVFLGVRAGRRSRP